MSKVRSKPYYEEYKEHFIALCENTGKWYTTQELLKIIPIDVTESTVNRYIKRMVKEKIAKSRVRPQFGRCANEHTVRSDRP